ncbi:polyprenyl synthetase family protein [Ornithinimicrobium panacihumi]|uniref:polyprenyl synthetase family protein n=1 Tax=Ornithinimicrobium panacihumi TaxID=2008449 RepID=UPI003F88D555
MPHAHPLDGVQLRERVQRALDEHLTRQREILRELGEPMVPLVDSVADLLNGGKRLRAAFFYWGWRAIGGADDESAVRAASAMEVFQAAALIHDDVMDNSDLRRGRPTAHRSFATRHAQARWKGDPERFGHAAAILAGDLCLNWTDEVFATSGLPPEALDRARPEFDRMRTQLMGGQFLDILEGAQGWDDLPYAERLERSRQVIRYKSAQYSVGQPLLIGAMAAGATPEQLAPLKDYGLSLGEAFQLRDDVLGVYGNPEDTGKPAGDDLREGKHTALIAHALELASPEGAELIAASLGDPDLDDHAIEACRQILVDSGALDRTEEMIEAGAAAALEALAATPDLTEEGRAALVELVAICTDRHL